MGLRGIIRDLLGIYLGYEIVKGYFFGNFKINSFILLSAIALLVLAVWFILERLGIVPRITES